MSKLTSDEAEAGHPAQPSDPTVDVTAEPTTERPEAEQRLAAEPATEQPVAERPEAEQPVTEPTTERLPDAGTGAHRRRPSRVTLLAAGLGVLLLALWVAGGLLLMHDRAVDRVDAERAPALAAAQRVAADLTSINADNVQQRVQSLVDESTGGFHKQISTYASALQTVLSQARVGSQGRVSAGGIERIDQNSAVALVTVVGSVSGGVLPDAEPISYRLAVQLQHENGRWLTTDVTFVK
jgi:Mce-associated membrane protein